MVHIDRVRPLIGGDTGAGAPQGGVAFGGDREIHTGVGCGGGQPGSEVAESARRRSVPASVAATRIDSGIA